MFPRIFFLALTWLLLPWASAMALDHTTFFKQHCVKCHGGEKQEGEIRFDNLTSPEGHPDQHKVWVAAL